MNRSVGFLFVLYSCIAGFTSGCITINPGAGLSAKSKKQKIQNASFEETIDEAPGEPENLNQLKLTYAQLMEDVGRLTEARDSYHFVVSAEPENLTAVLGMARLELMSGNYLEAEKGFKKALKINPNSAEANYGLGQFYASQELWSQSVDPMTKAMLSEPNNSQYRYSLAVALTNAGDINSALPHFIRTVGDAEAHYNVAVILKQKGELETAEKHLVMAITKKPELKDARASLQEIRNQQAVLANVKASNSFSSQIVPSGHLMRPDATSELSNSQQQQLSNQSPLVEQL